MPVCTFGTLGARSAILTAARGMGIDIDIANYMTSMIGQERGFTYSIRDCVYGNPKEGRHAVPALVAEFENFPNFLETVLEIEGLVNQIGIHASGMLIVNKPFHEQNAIMRAPNGMEISQYDLGDSEYMGGLKMDCLSVEALDKIHVTMDLLLESGDMVWQGSLKDTYNYYLHPDKLIREDKAMWELVWNNEIIDIFQMNSTVGKQTLSQIKPENIPQLAAANSLMRLMPEGGQKTPTEEYVAYKNNPKLLRDEVYNLVATDKEKDILYNYMKKYGGVLDTQESAMAICMIPEFANFDVPLANKLRKVISKKLTKEIDAMREVFFKKGEEVGCSYDILHYIWDIQIKRQLGYSLKYRRLYTVRYIENPLNCGDSLRAYITKYC